MLLLISHSLGLTPFLKGEHPVMQPIAKMFAHSFTSYGWLKGPQTVWDMIMPAFMFAMGVSMFLSGKGQVSVSAGRSTIVLRAVKRAAVLYLLGNIIHGIQSKHLELDVFGVLPQIANIYLLTTLILLLPRRKQVVTVIVLLIGYLLLFELVPPPAAFAAAGPHAAYAHQANIGSYIDKMVFHQTYPWVFIAMVPFSAITMLGYWCGSAIKSDWPGGRKVLVFLAAGLASVASGWLLALWIPMDRCLMTVSFTIYSAGIVLLFFAVSFWIIDVRGYKGWAFPLVVIGANAIVIYFLAKCTETALPETTLIFTKSLVDQLGHAGWGATFNYWVCTALYFLLALWLYRNKLFIRV